MTEHILSTDCPCHPRVESVPATDAGKRLLAWAESDARPIQEFGWDGMEEAISDIEAEALCDHDGIEDASDCPRATT
jgi:hypothetical protein